VPVKVVSEMLGHRTIAIKLRTHAHVLEDVQAAAAAQAGTLLGRALVIAADVEAMPG
jgi:hypothetical protein